MYLITRSTFFSSATTACSTRCCFRAIRALVLPSWDHHHHHHPHLLGHALTRFNVAFHAYNLVIFFLSCKCCSRYFWFSLRIAIVCYHPQDPQDWKENKSKWVIRTTTTRRGRIGNTDNNQLCERQSETETAFVNRYYYYIVYCIVVTIFGFSALLRY